MAGDTAVLQRNQGAVRVLRYARGVLGGDVGGILRYRRARGDGEMARACSQDCRGYRRAVVARLLAVSKIDDGQRRSRTYVGEPADHVPIPAIGQGLGKDVLGVGPVFS